MASLTPIQRLNGGPILDHPSRIGDGIIPPVPGAVPAPTVPPVIGALAPGSNPFDHLPFPAPGDRIKADDFKALSQALTIVANMSKLSGSLLGHAFAEARTLLVGQGYQLVRVMSVFGTEIDNLGDTSLDARKIVQVVSTGLGGPGIAVVVTEAVDARRFVPNLSGLTYPQALERVHALVGQVPPGATAPTAPALVGLTLADASKGATK
jgi:hypothetical protein